MAAESPPTAPEHRPPRVFLSYSHDSPQHAARVLALAQQLRRDGVDARIDQFDQFPPEGWPQWCARQILDARYSALVCTETYRRRFFGYEEAGVGRGVKWEGMILQNILYNDERNLRFIPVVFASEDEQFIPETLQGATRVLLADFGAADAGYTALVRRFTDRKTLPPLPDIPVIEDRQRPADSSIPTKEVWDEATTLVIEKLDEIHGEQKEHERKSGVRHRLVVAGLAVLAVGLVAGGPWIIREIRQAFAKTETIVADPVILRAKLAEKIDQIFEKKRSELLAAKAPSPKVDALYRWRDRATAQLTEAVAFITARAADPNSPIIKSAAVILEERGVDATLEFLDATLKAERQRRKEEGRQFAEASLMKAGLHESRLETDEQERAIRDAIADAPDWWRPHNELGLILYQRAQWQLAEREFEAARKGMPVDAESAVLNNLAALYMATNRIVEAEPLMERALKIAEKSDGPEHPNVAIRLNNLAQLYQATNRLAEAEPLMERALKIAEKSFGPEHPNAATDLNNLAQLYQATNRLAEAEPLMERALKIAEKSYGPEHPEVARDLNNLAALYQATNRIVEAEPLMKRALKIAEKSYGPEHPNVAIDLNNLAQLYEATNRLAEAEPLMERALKIDKKSYGPEHPKIAIRINNLAQLYKATNRLAEAEPLMERALKIAETSFGPEHPDVAIDLNNLAVLYKATNRLTEAEPLMERALKINEKSYGPDHPNVARDLSNLALLYKATNRVAEAEPLMKRALKIDEKSYGPEHPNVAIDLNNLAQLYKATNRLVEAEPLMERALKIDKKSYGPEHPNVARNLNNLAQLYGDTGRLAEAEPLMKRALKIDEKSYGPEHPKVALDLNNLALLYLATNRLREAEPLMKRAAVSLLKSTRTSGHLEPNLNVVLTNFAGLLDAMALSPAEVTRRLAEAGSEAGHTQEEFTALLKQFAEQ